MTDKNVFELLEKDVKILAKKRFKKLTEIQQAVIPRILQGKNVLVISETGSGKTEAALLPIFNEIVKSCPKQISVLYITPLRSLNRDLLKRILWWANGLEFDVSVRHGDTSQYERKMQVENPPDMLISTPETLQAMLTGKLMREHLKNVKYIVVDEIHELVDNKRGVQLSIGLERLKNLIFGEKNENEKKRILSIIGLSATVGSPELVAKFLCPREECEVINIEKARKFKVSVESPSPRREDHVSSDKMIASPAIVSRLRRIDELIEDKKSVLIFTNTREAAEILSSRIRVFNSKLLIDTHHSSLSREVRISVEDGFKQEKLKALICTSSLELGIDIGSIDFILQYSSPRQVTKILQRIGRSGHELTRIPDGVVIASDADDCFESSVIVDHALNGLMEKTKVYDKALDVLAHQIIGLAMEEYNIPLNRAYEIIKNAYPYRNLSEDEFFALCLFLEKLRLVWINKKEYEAGKEKEEIKKLSDLILKRRKNSFLYYYSNLSTIPDVKNYNIIDVVANKPVGSLDAEFIALHGSPGTAFIVKGQAWRILDVGKTRILVEPMPGLEAAIPAWEGELIPVPYDVAQGVGRMRRDIADFDGNVFSYLTKKYPITKSTAKKIISTVRKQKGYGFVPDDKNILIEHGVVEDGCYVIMHACFGSLVNDTIGRALSIMLTPKIGSVGLQTDPYRIIIKLPGYGTKEVIETFKKLTPDTMETVLEINLPDTELFMWRFMHVAKRFGIISRDADFGKTYLRRIIESYVNTPVYKETMNEIMQGKTDIKKASEILNLIRKGDIKITVKEGLSQLGRLGLIRKYEIIAPDKPEREIFEVFKKRLLDTNFGLICCNCGSWIAMGSIRDLPEKPICKRCEARLISTVKPRFSSEAESLIKKHFLKKKLSSEEKRWLDWMMDAGNLVINYGHDAIKVMAGRGIGPKTAARILSKMHTGDDLLKDILHAEKQYAKTRRFWRD